MAAHDHLTGPARDSAADRWVDDPGVRGSELVKEIVVCEKCAAGVM